MKLTELNPRWVGAGGEGISDAQGNPVPKREGVGVSFDCPCGTHHEESDRVFVHIDPPLDGKPFDSHGHPQWRRTGDTFDDLTLSPSIQRVGGCNWHGFVEHGEVRTA